MDFLTCNRTYGTIFFVNEIRLAIRNSPVSASARGAKIPYIVKWKGRVAIVWNCDCLPVDGLLYLCVDLQSTQKENVKILFKHFFVCF